LESRQPGRQIQLNNTAYQDFDMERWPRGAKISRGRFQFERCTTSAGLVPLRRAGRQDATALMFVMKESPGVRSADGVSATVARIEYQRASDLNWFRRHKLPGAPNLWSAELNGVAASMIHRDRAHAPSKEASRLGAEM